MNWWESDDVVAAAVSGGSSSSSDDWWKKDQAVEATGDLPAPSLLSAKTGVYKLPSGETTSAFATTPEQIAAMNEPLIPRPDLKIAETDPQLVKASKAVANTVGDFVSGMTSGTGLISLIPPIGLSMMAGSVPDLITQVQEAEKTPAGSAERWQAGTNVVGFMGLIAGGAKAVEKGKAAEVKATETFIPPPADEIISMPDQISLPTNDQAPLEPSATNSGRPAEAALQTIPSSEPLPPENKPLQTTQIPASETEIPVAQPDLAPQSVTGQATLRATPADIGGFQDSPLISFIKNDIGGILSRTAAREKWGTDKYEANKSLWDDAPNLRSPRHNSIYNSRTGVSPDEAASAAVNEGLLPEGATETDLWRAVQRASDAAHMQSGAEMIRRAGAQNAFRQYKAFSAAIEAPQAGEKPITGAQLNVGDSIKIGTETMKVTDIDPDTYDVTLEDGSKFGIQHVADQQAFYGEIQPPDPAALADRATREVTFLPPKQDFALAKPETVSEQQARFAREAAGQQATSQREQIAARAAVPLVGSTGDIGQGTLFGKEDIFGFGPGAASAGEPLSVGSQINQLTNIVANSLTTSKPLPMASRLQRAINSIGGSVVTARQTVGRGLNTARAAWLALKNGVLRPPIKSDFVDSLKDWQGADQRTSFEVRQFVNKLRTQIKDPLVREGITNYIQADGDRALLQQRSATSNIKYRPGYEAALRLTNEQQVLAANVRQYFDAMLQDGINAGLIDHGLDNYITQIWKRPNKFTQELQADLQAGKLQTNFNYARKRVFDSFFDGEQANYAPATKDVSALVAAYDLSFNKSLAARGFVKALRDAKAADGEPVVKFSGMTQPVPHGAQAPEAYLIRSRTIPKNAVTKDGRAYRVVDHPALRGWKFVVQDGAKAPAYFQADMLVHPDHAAHLQNVLGRSWFRQNPITGTMLKAGALAKQTKLSLSIFHLDQEGLHGLFHRVNPANLDKINFDDPTQWRLVRNGLQVADYQAMELFAEGLRGGGLVSKIPVLGDLQHKFNEFLFKDYIPRLKMTMARHAFERNVKRYPPLSPDVVAELTARQANAAFGELNYKLMGRNPSLQDFLRLTVLAPDFLEARGRFVGQALKPYGGEQRAALLLGAATMYVAARALNQWLDNDPHWNKPFSVIYNGREYRLRTVMGDAAEVFMDPRRFFYNRFSPWLKSGVVGVTRRDQRGIKLSNLEVVKDMLSWFVPIPLGKQEGANVVQRVLGSSGVSNKPAETPVDQMYKSAAQFKEGLTDPKVQAEVKRAQQETYAQSDYAKLNRAILDNDKERATGEIVDLLKSGKDAATVSKFYSNLPSKPFTGSNALEASFLRQMSDVERARYNSARNQRINMAKTFFSLFPNALSEYRKSAR